MARRTIVEQEPQRDDQRELQDNEALAAHVANEPEPSTERRPQRAPMSPEMLAEKQEELRALEEQLEQNQEQLRDLLETKAKSGDMKRVAELTKESAKLSKKIAELTFALRQEKNAQELQSEVKPKIELGIDSVTKMEQRLRVLSEDLAMTKSEKRKASINAEVDTLVAAIAKERNESADMLRARFVVETEDLPAKKAEEKAARAREAEEKLVAEGINASRLMGEKQKERANLALKEQAVKKDAEYTAAAEQMRRKPGEYKKQTEQLNEIAEKLGRVTNRKDRKALEAKADLLIPVLAKAQGVSEEALRASVLSARELGQEKRVAQSKDARAKQLAAENREFEAAVERMKSTPGETQKQLDRLLELGQAFNKQDRYTEMQRYDLFQEAQALIPILAKALSVKKEKLYGVFGHGSFGQGKNAFYEGMKQADAAAADFRALAEKRKQKEKAKEQITPYITKVRKNLEARKDERETYQALHDEMRQITEQKDAKAMAAFYESLKQLARDSKSPEQAAAEKLLAELNAETTTQARKKEQREMADIDKGFEGLHEEMQKTDEIARLKKAGATLEAIDERAIDEELNESIDTMNRASANLKQERFDQEVLAGVDRLRPDAVRKTRKETAPRITDAMETLDTLSENITQAITNAEADYFREQAKGPLTREEMRAAGLSGVGDMVGWRSAEERRQAMKTREELMNQLNAITWKFWQAPGLRRQIAEIDRNEAAFQNDISGRLAKRSMKNPRSANTGSRPGGGFIPRV